jgi:GNAT superfamily N-acetyltransferase
MIRRATPADKSRVLVLARNFHQASGLPIPFSAPFASLLFDACLSDQDRLCLVLDIDGVQGVLAAQAGLLPLAPVKAATELIWWIEPAHRGRSALAMLDAYETWARERGCVFANMVGLGSDPLPARLYERRGYIAAERHFMKPL